ncbi:MAG TPA: toll/interleukin-1 receptor domain-containing protein [Allosphingosinicella sp.]
MVEPAGAPIRYTAFLSYSHKDAAAAARLHRRLETYRLPKRLVGSETAHGQVPDRLWPIFRDREELPAATDLSETVRSALSQSGALIILCSPNSAGSLWVAEEIQTFRALHPDRPILAAILDGSPPDCFPAALRASGNDGKWHEPLAADLRARGDGGHLGLLKLVAGITGVGLDSLVQRDAARRIHRVMVVTTVAVVAMLIMAAMAWFALDARREAERQRAEAEGMAKFMLTDLREKLREVGRLDIMRAANERALAYHNNQLRLYHRTTDQIMRARVLQAIGEDDIERGNLDVAIVNLREAHRITGDQLARVPSDPQRLFDHARSEYWIGRVHELRREWPLAQRQYVRFANATQRLIEAAPTNPDYLMEAGWSAFDLGNVQLNGTSDFAGAQSSYERAIHWFGRAATARPRNEDSMRAQANAYAALADSFYMRADWQRSLMARLQQYRMVEALHRANPSNLESAFRYALAERGLAVAFIKVGNRANARLHMLEAYRWSLNLRRRDPGNAEWLLFGAQVACEFYFRDLGLPQGVSRVQLADAIRSARAELSSQENPNGRAIDNCVRALH